MTGARLRHAVRLRVEPSSHARPLLNLEQIESGTGRVVGELSVSAPAGSIRFEPGDVLFSKLRPYLAKSVRVREPMQGTGELLAMVPGSSVDSRYLLYLTLSTSWLEAASLTAYGTKMPRTSWEAMADFRLPDIPLDHQRRIADFLDDQVARIDSIIATRRGQVGLIDKERRSARAEVLAGDNRGGHHRLLGPVDSSWPLRRLAQVVSRVGVGVVVNPSSYFADTGVPFLHGGNVREGHFELDNVKRITEKNSRMLWRSRLDAGDVVVVRAGYPGRAAVVPPDLAGANCASIILIKPAAVVLASWIELFFNSPQGRAQVGLVQYGAAQEQINVGDVVNFVLPVPTPQVQRGLLRQHGEVMQRQGLLLAAVETQMHRLDELKQSLITAAVTGEFDVSTADGSRVPA